MMELTGLLCALACVNAGSIRGGTGNTFGQQRRLGDFVFAPTLSGNDHLRTGDIETGGKDFHYYGKGNTFGQQRRLCLPFC